MAAALTLCVLIVTGCGGSSQSSAPTGAAHVDLLLDSYPAAISYLHDLPLFVAEHEGFLRDNHVALGKIYGSEGGGTSIRNLVGARVTAGTAGTVASLQGFGAGAPVVAIAGNVQSSADAYFVTRADAPYSSVQDLQGHTWCYTNPSSTTQGWILLMLKRLGLSPAQYTLRASGGVAAGLTLLQQGGCDATILPAPLYATDSSKYKTIVHVNDVIPNYEQELIVTTPAVLRNQADVLRRLLAAWYQGQMWLYAHPTQAGQILHDSVKSITLTDAVSSVEALAKGKYWNLAITSDAMNNALQGAVLAGSVKSTDHVDWSKFLDQRLLPAGVSRAETSKFQF